MEKHIISILTQNASGVLYRISGLVRRKLFNIDSLTVGDTSNPEKARFTISLTGSKEEAQKLVQAISKLVEVIEINILNPEKTISREIVLAKLMIMDEADEAILKQSVEGIVMKEISRSGHQICIELMDSHQVLENFLDTILHNNIEVVEWIRSGLIATEA